MLHIDDWLDAPATGPADYLSKHGIPFVSKNNGAHLIVEGSECFIDYWPGTGKWHSRCGKQGFGVRKLIAFIETSSTQFRLLKPGERIEKDDEYLEDDCKTWSNVSHIMLRCEYNPLLFVPHRRIVLDTSASITRTTTLGDENERSARTS